MVHGTVHLENGETVIIVAKDMLAALKRATKMYHGIAVRMYFKTVGVKIPNGREADVYTEDY